MFDIGWTELLLLAVLILLVLGPKELPVMLRGAGEMLGRFRTMAFNFRRQLEIIPQDKPKNKDD